jgi:hypothetical protein
VLHPILILGLADWLQSAITRWVELPTLKFNLAEALVHISNSILGLAVLALATVASTKTVANVKTAKLLRTFYKTICFSPDTKP